MWETRRGSSWVKKEMTSLTLQSVKGTHFIGDALKWAPVGSGESLRWKRFNIVHFWFLIFDFCFPLQPQNESVVHRVLGPSKGPAASDWRQVMKLWNNTQLWNNTWSKYDNSVYFCFNICLFFISNSCEMT